MAYTYPKNAAGKRVPSVTTIIGNRKQSGGLMHWAWQQGIDGKDYRETASAAASGGSYAHACIEARVKAYDPIPEPGRFTEDAVKLGAVGFDAYLAWEKHTKLDVRFSEVPVCHEEMGYGGTLDAIAEIDGKICLLDFKCSNGTYLEHVVQLAAYWKAWEFSNTQYPLHGWHLLRIGKEYADFHHHSYTLDVMSECWQMFRHMKALYDLDKKLKNVAS